ncbi:amidohydrolase family protein [Amycolatopsis thermoflava]|uniref:amidohydrolase family protein n=1 Tax=Amycolatopsis thermoflava TaxID=84480 RepID=UPI000F4B4F3F|nr:amidohydrolase family protein [Amycolatopsis thermoflava]
MLPGFIDCHVHAWEGIFRGAAPDAGFLQYLQVAHLSCAPRMTPEDILAGQRMTALQALNAGVTTVVDNSHNTQSVDHGLAAIEGLRSTGIRAVVAVGAPVTTAADRAAFLQRFADILTECPPPDDMLALRVFASGPSQALFEFAQAHGAGVCSELVLGVPVPEIGLPAALGDFFGQGLIRPEHTFNHCIGLSQDQWSELRDVGAGANLTPRSDPHFGIGPSFPAVLEAQQSGIEYGISSDNELCYGLDFFTEMRTLMTLQRSAIFPRLAASEGYRGARPFETIDVLRAATSGGSASAGKRGSLGILRAGLPADLIAIATDRAHLRARGDAVGIIVNFAATADVDAVFVDGKVRKWGDRVTSWESTWQGRSRRQRKPVTGFSRKSRQA